MQTGEEDVSILSLTRLGGVDVKELGVIMRGEETICDGVG